MKKQLKKLVNIIAVASASLAVIGCVCSISIIAPTIDAQAASTADCLSSSGADQVASVQYACNACFTSGSGSSRGTLWFNSSSTNKNSDEVVAYTNSTTIPIYMWGQVYSCAQTGTSTNVAMYIWLGDAGQMSDPSQSLSYISVSSSLNRGTGTGHTYTWYSPSSNNSAGSIDVAGFIAHADSHTVEIVGNTTYEIYKKTVSVNRCFSNAYGRYVYDGSVCYGDDSVITLRLENTPDPEPEDGAGDAYFYSTSTASVSGGRDYPSLSETTSPDGYSEIKFSTDESAVTIDFSHTMYYVNNGSYDSKDTFPTVSTNWSVSGSGASYSSTGTYSTGGKTSGNSQVNSNSVTISLSPGDTKTICQTISYRPKYLTFSRTEKFKWVTDYGIRSDGTYGVTGSHPEHDYWAYSLNGSSGSNYSRACVEVTRPADPSGTPTSSGTMNSTLMYAGETTTIGWSVSGTSYPTRRLAEWQAVVYQVPSTVNYYNGITTGNNHYTGSGACAYYNGKSSTRYCGVFNSQSGTTGFSTSKATHNATSPSTFSAVVPDYVGDKYCNGFAYRYEYWYYTTNGGWQKYGTDYWYVYNSVCRTIAKKPSTATWNGSVMSAGGVKTSMSYRYNSPSMGAIESDSSNGGRKLFASWSEFLAAINGTVDGYTSGAMLSLGSSQRDVYENSPLTIANQSSSLGSSGILNNTSLRTRLNTYLKNNGTAVDLASSSIGGSGWTNLTGTHIVRRSGTLNITGNITLSLRPYSSIYQLPQVVIFVDGDVNISSNVSQIDAWIIATGKINTCSEFQRGTTEADTVSRYSSACASQLVFNGPVMADSIVLNRSYGSDPLISRAGTFGDSSQRYTAAEIFNYRADAYLWAYAQAGRYSSSYTETYTRELAPRY